MPISDWHTALPRWRHTQTKYSASLHIRARKIRRPFDNLATITSIDNLSIILPRSAVARGERRNISDIHVTCWLLTSNFQHLRALFLMRKEVCARRTRGHALRFEHVRCKCSIRQRFVTNRAVNTWNNLTDAKIRQMQINTHFAGHRRINSNAFVASVM